MVNVNEVVQRYRLALRHIWNECFWVDPELRDWESVYAFRKLQLASIQVNVSVPSSPTGVWLPVTGSFKREQVEFTLIDFFGWGPLRYIDLQYYVVLIDRLDGHEDRVGQHAVIEVAQGDVTWDSPQAVASAFTT